MSILNSAVDPASETFSENRDYVDGLNATLRERLAVVAGGGREALLDRHHKRGKLLARERIDRLVDPGTAFLEFSTLLWLSYS